MNSKKLEPEETKSESSSVSAEQNQTEPSKNVSTDIEAKPEDSVAPSKSKKPIVKPIKRKSPNTEEELQSIGIQEKILTRNMKKKVKKARTLPASQL
jgi:hypothetical protein